MSVVIIGGSTGSIVSLLITIGLVKYKNIKFGILNYICAMCFGVTGGILFMSLFKSNK